MSVSIAVFVSQNALLTQIRPDTEPDMEKWVEFNRKYSEIWPVIITQKDPLPDAEERDGEAGKLEKYFSEKPGEGG